VSQNSHSEKNLKDFTQGYMLEARRTEQTLLEECPCECGSAQCHCGVRQRRPPEVNYYTCLADYDLPCRVKSQYQPPGVNYYPCLEHDDLTLQVQVLEVTLQGKD
jgi:hypothetical protein